jgi:membrane associated rhomboid family serine protease
MLVFMIVLILFFNFISSSAFTDTTGHIGGALTGFLWGLAFFPRV